MISELQSIVGVDHVLTSSEAMQPHLSEWRRLYHGRCGCVVKPHSVDEVSAVVRLAGERGVPIVPQGGNTGLVGGQIPFDERAIVLCLSRMTQVRDRDGVTPALIVEAGCTLASVQTEADAMGLLFPLRLASEGSCQIGGTIATNAGGTAVLAYGSMRSLVLGLEVVLPNGDIWHGLRRLYKDNAGYDLKQMFIGSEGTLGIVTAVTLRLFPEPSGFLTAFVGVSSVEAALSLFLSLRQVFAGRLTTCELMPEFGLDVVTRHVPDARRPVSGTSLWWVLVEISEFEAPVFDALASILTDYPLSAVAQSEAQRADFWRLREAMSEAQSHEGGSIKHDVSVPVADIPAFLQEASLAVLRLIPECRPLPFGHIGDGNIHFNISQPISMDKADFLARWGEINALVHEIVVRYGGSIAAEHGVGLLKRDALTSLKSGVDLDLMRRLKHALDPKGLLNPDKVLKFPR